MAETSNIDVGYALYQIGGKNDYYSVKRVLYVSANHCIP
jgi:hypothetical protein